MTLTYIYTTNRDEPQFDWFYESVRPTGPVIVVDGQFWTRRNLIKHPNVQHVPPKPTVWSGPERLTKENWWSVSNSRNTGICLCKTPWICFVDDRSVMLPGWAKFIERAVNWRSPYVLLGRYEKRKAVTVENGVIINAGIVTGVDSRFEYCEKHWVPRRMEPPYKCGGEWAWGCTTMLPLEWCLQVGGYEECADGLGGEDYLFGTLLQNNGFPIYYEPRMIMVEDRTPELCSPVAKKSDYGKSPEDWSHKILQMTMQRKTTMHGFDIRQVRADVLAGKPFPAPWGPVSHPWNNVPLGQL